MQGDVAGAAFHPFSLRLFARRPVTNLREELLDRSLVILLRFHDLPELGIDHRNADENDKRHYFHIVSVFCDWLVAGFVRRTGPPS